MKERRFAVKETPYITREQIKDLKTYKQPVHKYTFNGLLRPDIILIDVYRHYFSSEFKKDKSISYFVETAIELFMYKRLYSTKQETFWFTELINDIFGVINDHNHQVHKYFQKKTMDFINTETKLF